MARIDGSISIATVQAELVEMIQDVSKRNKHLVMSDQSVTSTVHSYKSGLQHDTPWKYQDFTDPYFFMEQLKSLRSISNQKRISTVKDVMYRKFAGKGTNFSYWSANQWGLCSGENFRVISFHVLNLWNRSG